MKKKNINDSLIAVKPHISGSLLSRSLNLLEEIVDNYEADALSLHEKMYKEIKKLIKDIKKSNIR